MESQYEQVVYGPPASTDIRERPAQQATATKSPPPQAAPKAGGLGAWYKPPPPIAASHPPAKAPAPSRGASASSTDMSFSTRAWASQPEQRGPAPFTPDPDQSDTSGSRSRSGTDRPRASHNIRQQALAVGGHRPRTNAMSGATTVRSYRAPNCPDDQVKEHWIRHVAGVIGERTLPICRPYQIRTFEGANACRHTRGTIQVGHRTVACCQPRATLTTLHACSFCAGGHPVYECPNIEAEAPPASWRSIA